MSDQPPRPSPGTKPIAGPDIEPRIHAHRPHPETAAQDEQRGRVTQTEQLRIARAEAAARDLSYHDQDFLSQRPPGAMAEVESTTRQVVAELAERAGPGIAAAMTDDELSERRLEQARRALVEADADLERRAAERPNRPAWGTHLTAWWVPALALIPLVFLELEFTTDFLLVVLPSVGKLAPWLAGLIALTLTAAVEVGALIAGARFAHASRRAVVLSSALAVLAFAGMATWSVTSIAGARGPGLAYADSLKPKNDTPAGSFGGTPAPAAGATSGGFGAPASGGFGEPASATHASASAPKPPVGFIVPVTLLALLTGAALSMRSSAAAPWKRFEEDWAAAEARRAGAATAISESELDREQASGRLDELERAFGAAVERELQFSSGLLDRIQQQYASVCTRHGRVPVTLPRVPLPSAETLVELSLNPPRARRVRRDAATTAEPAAAAPRDSTPDAGDPAPDPQPAAPPPSPDEDPWTPPPPSDEQAAPHATDAPEGWVYDGPPLDLDDEGDDGTGRHNPPPGDG
jgi:hypothetical protein